MLQWTPPADFVLRKMSSQASKSYKMLQKLNSINLFYYFSMHVQLCGCVTKAKLSIIIVSKNVVMQSRGLCEYSAQTTRVQCPTTKFAGKPIIRKCLTKLIRK